MPLTRGALPSPPAVKDLTTNFTGAITQLASDEAPVRRRAASALGEAPPGTPQAREAALALAGHLRDETDSSVREAAFLAFAQLGGAETAALVGSFLRAEDAALRRGALETLRRLGDAAIEAVDLLLRDPDPDVRMLSAEVMRKWPPCDACPRLEVLLTQDEDINVCGVALDISRASGDASLLPAICLCRQRFAGHSFVEFAVDFAIAGLGAPSPAVDPVSTAPNAPHPARNTRDKPATRSRSTGKRLAKAPGA